MKRSRFRPNFFTLPATIFLLAFTIFPLVYLLYLSSLNFVLRAATPVTFVGLSNYIAAFTSPQFQQSVVLSLWFGVALTAVELSLGLGIALLLNRNTPIAKFAQVSLILPLMMTPFLIYMDWDYLLIPGVGPIPYIIGVLTGNYNPDFFSAVPNVYLSLIMLDIWQWLPFVIILALAGLRSLPPQPFEAASIDGAGNWAKFRYLTLPLLRPVLAIIILFRLVDSFKIFDSLQLFTGGGPGTDTYFINWLVYETGLGFIGNVGLSSAYSVIYLAIVFAIAGSMMYVIYRSVNLER